MEELVFRRPFTKGLEVSEEEAQEALEEQLAKHKANIKASLKEIKLRECIAWIRKDFRNTFIKDCPYQQLAGNAQVFVNNFDKHFKYRGLYIYGTVGTGKTYLASMIANEMAIRGKKVLLIPFNEAVLMYNNPEDETLKILITSRYFDLIILDDFGTSRETDFQIEQIYNLVNGINQAHCSVSVTTNIPRSDLAKTSDMRIKRIYDRIIGFTTPIPAMIGESKRLEKARETAANLQGMFK